MHVTCISYAIRKAVSELPFWVVQTRKSSDLEHYGERVTCGSHARIVSLWMHSRADAYGSRSILRNLMHRSNA